MKSSHRRHDRDVFFKYTSASAAEAILESRSLRWSCPTRFNDPFDVPLEAELGFTPAELREALEAELLAVLKGSQRARDPNWQMVADLFQADGNEDRRQFVLETIRQESRRLDPRMGSTIEAFKTAWREILPKLRILCLSEIPDSIPMWAHYAEGHTGVVLEFEANDELDSVLLLAQPVIYSADPPKLPPAEVWARAIVTGQNIDWQEYFREYYYVKTIDWSYEREWRVISRPPVAPDELLSYLPFNPRELKGVYFGAEISDENRRTLSAKVSGDLSHVKLYSGVLDHATRRLTFQLESP